MAPTLQPSPHRLWLRFPCTGLLVVSLLGGLGFGGNPRAIAQTNRPNPSPTAPPSRPLPGADKSYCELENFAAAATRQVVATSIHVQEKTAQILEICLQFPGQVKASLSGEGDLTLLSRPAGTNLFYYPGSNSLLGGKVQQVGDIVIQYLVTGPSRGKVRQLGPFPLDYYTVGHPAGKIRQLADVPITYHELGWHRGALRQVGGVLFEYDRNLVGNTELNENIFTLRTRQIAPQGPAVFIHSR